MAQRHRRLRLGIAGVSSGLLLCCLLPYVALDPLLNVALFGGIAPPVIPEHPNGQSGDVGAKHTPLQACPWQTLHTDFG